jgi:A/G-specific adenine glycosylase
MPRSRQFPPPFSQRVIRWQAAHGRRGLPWQGTRDAYRVWLSEVMLQQTQVATVIPYYERFLVRFPDVRSLAAACVDDVLVLWSGLGYYARARNLHRAAQAVVEHHAGRFPTTFEALEQLPGIGRSTAGAIAAFAGGERRAILDGNVRRVLARHAGISGDPSSAATLDRLWDEAETRLPRRGIESYTQGMMDLGADVCLTAKPLCLACPVNVDCVARSEGRVDELPGKRARPAPRVKRIAMLIVVSRGEVLLEKRPPSGIWGGLWSLPEASADVKPAVALQRDWGIECARIEALEPFDHAFTHFMLEIVPWRVQLAKSAGIAEGRGATWMPLADIAGAALPSPVKKLLSRLVSRA